MDASQNFSHPYGLCPKCSTPLIYNRYNCMIDCPRKGCFYSRDFTKEDDEAANDALAQEFQRNLKFDETYQHDARTFHVVGRGDGKPITTFMRACELLGEDRETNSKLMQNIFDTADESKG